MVHFTHRLRSDSEDNSFCNPQHKSVMEVTVFQAQSIKISVKEVFPLQSCDQEPSIVSYIHLQKMNQRLIIL